MLVGTVEEAEVASSSSRAKDNTRERVSHSHRVRQTFTRHMAGTQEIWSRVRCIHLKASSTLEDIHKTININIKANIMMNMEWRITTRNSITIPTMMRCGETTNTTVNSTTGSRIMARAMILTMMRDQPVTRTVKPICRILLTMRHITSIRREMPEFRTNLTTTLALTGK